MIFQTKKKKQVEFLFQYNFSEVRGMGRVNSVILPVWLVNKSVYICTEKSVFGWRKI